MRCSIQDPSWGVLFVRRIAACLALFLSAGASASDGDLQAEAVQGTTLALRSADGRLLSGEALVGQTFTLGGIRLRVNDVALDDRKKVWLHELVAQGVDGQWSSICSPDINGRRWALFMAGSTTRQGRFKPVADQVSVTCSSGAEGKCLRAGYFPETGPSLERFEACKRMIRADYCGDGSAWTRDGTTIDIFDHVGIQDRSADPSMAFEAAWSAQGAVCVHHTRIPGRLSLAELVRRCPRLKHAVGAACTEAAANERDDTLLFNGSLNAPASLPSPLQPLPSIDADADAARGQR